MISTGRMFSFVIIGGVGLGIAIWCGSCMHAAADGGNVAKTIEHGVRTLVATIGVAQHILLDRLSDRRAA